MRSSRPFDFDAMYIPEPNSGCWLWLGWLDEKGYARHSRHRAHRLYYERYKGPIPDGLVLDHLCRVRCCVNPDHLEAVTSKVNTLRGIGPTAVNAQKTHCSNGHELSGDNIKMRGGQRHCHTCDTAHIRAYKQKKRVEAQLAEITRQRDEALEKLKDADLKLKIALDPDIEVEAGILHPEAQAKAGAVQGKPLEWHTTGAARSADPFPGIRYLIVEMVGRRPRWQLTTEVYGSPHKVALFEEHPDTVAAAQADFDQRIRSALTSPEAPGVEVSDEEIAAQCGEMPGDMLSRTDLGQTEPNFSSKMRAALGIGEGKPPIDDAMIKRLRVAYVKAMGSNGAPSDEQFRFMLMEAMQNG